MDEYDGIDARPWRFKTHVGQAENAEKPEGQKSFEDETEGEIKITVLRCYQEEKLDGFASPFGTDPLLKLKTKNSTTGPSTPKSQWLNREGKCPFKTGGPQSPKHGGTSITSQDVRRSNGSYLWIAPNPQEEPPLFPETGNSKQLSAAERFSRGSNTYRRS